MTGAVSRFVTTAGQCLLDLAVWDELTRIVEALFLSDTCREAYSGITNGVEEIEPRIILKNNSCIFNIYSAGVHRLQGRRL